MVRSLLALVALGLVALGCGDDTEVGVVSPPPTVDTVANSVVRIVGLGCGAPALGSGFAVEEHVIVTSGHIVTGRDPASLAVIRPNGEEAPAVLVAFDADLDLALLRIDDLAFEPVTLTAPAADQEGTAMVMTADNSVEEVEFVVDAPVMVNWDGVFRDTESRFAGVRLDADINRGNSGGGLFVSETEVVGLIHSTTRSIEPRGYGVSATQIGEYLQTVDTSQEIEAPRCA
jgi:S1-C subfamily serine protease